MIETLQQNLEVFLNVIATTGVVAFVYLMVSVLKPVFKKHVDIYTPFIAIILGMILGVYIMTALYGFDWILTLMGLIQGAILGASAVGLHQVASSPREEVISKADTIEVPAEIKDLLNYE